LFHFRSKGGWSVEAFDGELKGTAGVGDRVQAEVDPSDDHNARAWMVWPSSAYKNRQVAIGQIADLVGGLALTGVEGAGKLSGLLPGEQVVHVQDQREQGGEVAGRSSCG
jgi:hypothetical protein